MNDKMKITGLILGGYLLGRTKKLGLALTIASSVAGTTAVKNREQLLGGLKDVVDSSPELKDLQTKLTGRLVESGKSATKAMAAKGVDQLSSKLQDHTEKMKSSLDGGAEDVDPESGEVEDPEGSTSEEPEEADSSADSDEEQAPEAEDTTTSSDDEERGENDADAQEAESEGSDEAAESEAVDEDEPKKPARKRSSTSGRSASKTSGSAKSSGTQRKQNSGSSSKRSTAKSATRKPKEATNE